MISQKFKFIRIGFQTAAVDIHIVRTFGSRRSVSLGKRKGKGAAKGIKHHLRSTRLAVGTIAGNMRRGNTRHTEKFMVDKGFMLPNIYHCLTDKPFAQSSLQRVGFNHTSARSINKKRMPPK